MRSGRKVDFAWREDSLNFDFIREHREEEKFVESQSWIKSGVKTTFPTEEKESVLKYPTFWKQPK